MTSEGLGDFADMCSEKFPFMLMGGRAEGLAFADLGAKISLFITFFEHEIIISKCFLFPIPENTNTLKRIAQIVKYHKQATLLISSVCSFFNLILISFVHKLTRQ